ncbi:hypothetical protein PMAYCL1PPCAC_12738, partial [Pristionchus mayeri]
SIRCSTQMTSFVTRSERAGNIFFRVTALIRSGQMKWADRPVWYDVYVAHPPLTAPDWNVQLPKHNEPVRKIFYEEDVVRAQFYKKHRYFGVIRMDNNTDSLSQKFINEYQAVRKEEPGLSSEEIFAQTEKRLEDLGLPLTRPVKKESPTAESTPTPSE